MADYKIITSDFVNVQITTSKDEMSSEKRFSKDISITELKEKLELMTGGSCATMTVEVYSADNVKICVLTDNEAMLGFYPIDDGMRLHVIDNFTLRNEFDSANVEKYEMPDEAYAKYSGSVRSFLLKNKSGKYSEEYLKKKEQQDEEEKQIVEAIVIGSRCQVQVANAPTRLGMVMYAGEVEEIPGNGLWIGVKYDEPLGKNDGSLKGKRYFECVQNYGAFVKPQNVECGDFPEQEYDLNEEI